MNADPFTASQDPDTAWTDDALCAQVDPELFFPETGRSNKAAKKTCRSCPVRAECLDYALEHDERHGIWAGLTVDERDDLRAATAEPASIPLAA